MYQFKRGDEVEWPVDDANPDAGVEYGVVVDVLPAGAFSHWTQAHYMVDTPAIPYTIAVGVAGHNMRPRTVQPSGFMARVRAWFGGGK